MSDALSTILETTAERLATGVQQQLGHASISQTALFRGAAPWRRVILFIVAVGGVVITVVFAHLLTADFNCPRCGHLNGVHWSRMVIARRCARLQSLVPYLGGIARPLDPIPLPRLR
jgi:hypothetical protein